MMEVLAELFYNGLVDSGAIFNQRNVPFSQQSTSFDAAQRAGDGAAKKQLIDVFFGHLSSTIGAAASESDLKMTKPGRNMG